MTRPWGMRRTDRRWSGVAAAICCAMAGGWDEAPAPGEEPPVVDYRSLARASLEDLLSLEVTSVAGVEQQWFRTPAAMYVITAQDIRRSGHQSIAEALRLAPGVHVGQINSSMWAVGTRGFNGRFANKQLVLIDGRTVYDPLFGGVFWDVQDVLLEDLDRIEIIRGPGATLWGANAVNGVINVTTRSAKETQGLYLSGLAGTHEHAMGMMRYGFKAGDEGWMRIWGKWLARDDFEDPSGHSTHDEWDMARGGFRYDRDLDEETVLTVQGDIYHTDRLGEQVKVPIFGGFASVPTDGRASGGDILFRFKRETAEHEGWSLQGYYDRTERVGANGFEVDRDTFDLDFRHYFQLGERHEMIWGLGYRHSRDRTESNGIVTFDPADRSLDTFSAFVQDTVTLVEDRLFFMAGSKFEHNDFTGFELQPGARLWWTPDERQTFWGAISRPVRVPSRAADDLALIAAFFGPLPFPLPPFLPVTIAGDRDVDAERLLAYEAGHRIKVTDTVTIDTALFYNDYEDLISLPGTGLTRPFGNDASGEAYGVETSVLWQVAHNWRLEASYSFLNVHVRGDAVIDDPERSHPHHMAQIRSHLDITPNLEFNAALYYVDHVPGQGANGYLRLDLGVTWRWSDQWEIAVWGQNLLDDGHREFGDALFQASPSEVPRAAYIQATARF